MSEGSIYNLHGLVSIHTEGFMPDITSVLEREMGRYRQTDSSPPLAITSICLVANSELDWPQLDCGAPDVGSEAFVAEWKERPLLCSIYRGRPDMLMELAAPYRISFVPRPRNADKLYGLLLFLTRWVLARQEAVLTHGAAVARDGKAVVLMGLRGSRKSLLLLQLLRDGWDLLADDKFILCGGKLLHFEDRLAVRKHHLQALPWLIGNHTSLKKCAGGQLSNLLETYCEQHLPSYLLRRVRKFYRPTPWFKTADVFPHCQVLERAELDRVVFISPGPRECRSLEINEAVSLIGKIQGLMFPDLEPLSVQIQMAFPQISSDASPIWTQALDRVPCTLFSAPRMESAPKLYQDFLQCIEPASSSRPTTGPGN